MASEGELLLWCSDLFSQSEILSMAHGLAVIYNAQDLAGRHRKTTTLVEVKDFDKVY